MKRYDLSDLRRRIEKLEARLAEIEKQNDCPTVEEIKKQSKLPASLAPEPDWEEIKARLAELEKQNDCPVEHRICRIEEQLAELERRCPHCGAAEGYMHHKDCYTLKYPEPEPVKEWRPKTKINLDFDNAFHNSSDEKIINKALPYILQLQWLLEHYPEETGDWSDKTQWFPYFDEVYEKWDVTMDPDSPTLNLIFMSYGAAKHLTADMNSGKVRF